VPPAGDYLERVNRAIDHVVKNLCEPLRLEDVARAAYFSPFHFHRVFHSVVGDTLGQFVKRLRLERALHMMSHAPKRSLTQIALACGFSSSSDFTRAFKQRYGVAPSRFDLASWRDSQREGLEAATAGTFGGHGIERLPAGENPDGFRVEMHDHGPRAVAYIRVLDPYRGRGVIAATERLVAWAEARGFANGQWLGYQWEDPEIVALEDCRYDVAVEVGKAKVDAKGEVGRFDFPAMRVARVLIRGGIDLEMRALDWLFRTWLPKSGYVPDDQPCFEAWIGRPFAHGFERFEIYVELPVRRG
jgi:AraC family transcriptional regulator